MVIQITDILRHPTGEPMVETDYRLTCVERGDSLLGASAVHTTDTTGTVDIAVVVGKHVLATRFNGRWFNQGVITVTSDMSGSYNFHDLLEVK